MKLLGLLCPNETYNKSPLWDSLALRASQPQGLSVNRQSLCQSLEIVPKWDYHAFMRIIALSTLKRFWESSPSYADSIEPSMAWYREALKADWASPNEVKEQFRSASILKDGRVVFNIAGNKYRLVVWINYAYRVVYIRFIGTHKQYDNIDVQTI